VSQGPEKYLVLCVDRDDDLGQKAKLSSPVKGREGVVAAATKLLLADPEEADANAMFAAVKKYDELVQGGDSCEVAVVCGDIDRGFKADRRVKQGVTSVVNSADATAIIFVSDGGDDEQVMPILQGISAIASVERVAVKHSETVEQNYLVLGRYLRMLVFDPHFSRWVLGVPGLILLLAGILIVSGQLFEAQLATLLIIGGAFFIRGFNLDRSVAGMLSRGPAGYLRIFSILTSMLIVLVGIVIGYSTMQTKAPALAALVAAEPSQLFVHGAALLGYFLNGSLLLIWVGIAVYTMGAMLSHIARDRPRRAWRDGVVLVMLALLYFPMETFSVFLIGGQREATVQLVSEILFGLAAIFGVSSLIYARARSRTRSRRK
jgi:putative membrane protein